MNRKDRTTPRATVAQQAPAQPVTLIPEIGNLRYDYRENRAPSLPPAIGPNAHPNPVEIQPLADNNDISIGTEKSEGQGRRKVLDLKTFIHLKKHEKIRDLLKYSEITEDEVAAILEIPKEQVSVYLSSGQFNESIGISTIDSMDRLLSILSFIFRLSDYVAEQMQRLWREKGYFNESIERPPWDDDGVLEFLKKRGQQGLVDSLNWIRSH